MSAARHCLGSKLQRKWTSVHLWRSIPVMVAHNGHARAHKEDPAGANRGAEFGVRASAE